MDPSIPKALFTSENIAIVALSFMVALLFYLLIQERKDRKYFQEKLIEGMKEITKAMSGIRELIITRGR